MSIFSSLDLILTHTIMSVKICKLHPKALSRLRKAAHGCKRGDIEGTHIRQWGDRVCEDVKYTLWRLIGEDCSRYRGPCWDPDLTIQCEFAGDDKDIGFD